MPTKKISERRYITTPRGRNVATYRDIDPYVPWAFVMALEGRSKTKEQLFSSFERNWRRSFESAGMEEAPPNRHSLEYWFRYAKRQKWIRRAK